MSSSECHIEIKHVNAWYIKTHALKDVSIAVPPKSIYAFIGPSGCGKTTLLRSINRLNDFVEGFRLDGELCVGGQNVYAVNSHRFVQELRSRIGMVFQQPNPLPASVMQNMLMPIRERYRIPESEMKDMAVEKLKLAAIYDEIKDRLNKTALSLSGGQQQRLCIARALMLEPKILLFDEPCSALDPISTFKIEELLTQLKEKYTIIMVTHNMEQARRIADYTAFFYEGAVAETGKTLDIFYTPKSSLLQNYITGRM